MTEIEYQKQIVYLRHDSYIMQKALERILTAIQNCEESPIVKIKTVTIWAENALKHIKVK